MKLSKHGKNILATVLILILSGCATTHTQDMLNSRMYKMTYEESLQRFGAPTQCAESGVTKVCTWVYEGGGTVLMPVGNMAMALPMQRPSARLTFTNGVLSYWQLTGNWE